MTLPNCLKNPKPVGTVYENIWSIRSDRDGVTVDPPAVLHSALSETNERGIFRYILFTYIL